MLSDKLMFVVMAGGVFVAGFWGCGSDEVPEATTGGGGKGTTNVSTTVTTSGGPVSTSTGVMVTNLGNACATDADCIEENLICITPEANDVVLTGGAVKGYCSAECLQDSECPGAGSVCRLPDGAGKGKCFLGCTIGPELNFIDDMLDGGKCHGREEVRCTSSNNQNFCLPTCGKDSQCPGRVCNLRSGFCTDTQSMGNPNGAVCDDNKPNEDGCAGFCQTFTGDSDSICVSPCVLAGKLDADDCGGLDNGLCIYRPGGFGAGDFGRCAAACTKHDECGNPDWWCQGGSFLQFTNGNGFCFTAIDCTQSSDCDTDEYCVDTKHGKKCLEFDPGNCGGGGAGGMQTCNLLFPLGDAALPGTGGGGGAGGN